jgi:hypothetical protein
LALASSRTRATKRSKTVCFDIRDFRYYDAGGLQPYAFIVNRESLLFYFRAPAVKSGKNNLAEIQALFTEVNQNNSGEWTVRIEDLAEAQRLSELLQKQ